MPELPQGTDFFSDFVELRAFAVALTKLVVPIGIKKEAFSLPGWGDASHCF